MSSRSRWRDLGLVLAGMALMAGTPAFAANAMQAYMKAMRMMDEKMSAAPMTGDPDHDFVTMMIPHDQGAIDMAAIELKYGKDPEILKMARKTVNSQTRDQRMMAAWLAHHPGKKATHH